MFTIYLCNVNLTLLLHCLQVELLCGRHALLSIIYVHMFVFSFSGSGQFISEPTVADNYSIQPHLEPKSLHPPLSSQLSQPPSSTNSQPNIGQGPPPSQSSGGSNPYRIGVGLGSKKPAYGVSGIASFGGPSGQSNSQPMITPSQPPPPASVQQSFSQVKKKVYVSFDRLVAIEVTSTSIPIRNWHYLCIFRALSSPKEHLLLHMRRHLSMPQPTHHPHKVTLVMGGVISHYVTTGSTYGLMRSTGSRSPW